PSRSSSATPPGGWRSDGCARARPGPSGRRWMRARPGPRRWRRGGGASRVDSEVASVTGGRRADSGPPHLLHVDAGVTGLDAPKLGFVERRPQRLDLGVEMVVVSG